MAINCVAQVTDAATAEATGKQRQARGSDSYKSTQKPQMEMETGTRCRQTIERFTWETPETEPAHRQFNLPLDLISVLSC